MKCPVCDSGNLLSSVLIDRLPVLCNELHADAASARRSETGRFDGCLCRDCGHFFNAAFDERKVRYTQCYDSSLDFSPRFVSFEDELARRLNASYDLAGKLIIDVGCGKGGFLRNVCSSSGARGVGFDKSFEQRSHNITGVRFVKNWFDETYAGEAPDLVACRHVLEHMAEPISFLRALNTHHSVRPDTVFYFEVPNALYTLRELGIWDLIYEHVSYFTPPSFRTALNIAGFEVVNAGTTFGEQFLYIEATTGKPQTRAFSSDVLPLEKLAGDFDKIYHSKISYWRDYIADRGPLSTAVWGAGSKGVNFLNVVPGASAMNAVIDLNPHKQGRYAPGTGTPIVPPADLVGRRISSVIVMNPVYYQEIVEMASALDRSLEISQA
jgi:SAM-dependent methyltransferase